MCLCSCADNCVQVKSIIFDKTGTVTHGVAHVSHIVMFVPRTDVSLQTVIAIAGSAETSSEHPVGKAIAKYAKKVVLLFSFCVFGASLLVLSHYFFIIFEFHASLYFYLHTLCML